MKKDDTVFLKHILDAITLIEDYLKDESYQVFRDNRMLQDAVIREIEIIGEATKNLLRTRTTSEYAVHFTLPNP